MNNPINFELAKLLKEKGYEQNPYKVFNSYLPKYKDGSEIYLNNSLYAPEYNICAAPTIVEVVMWLYEKHGIWIESPFWDSKFRIKIVDTTKETVLRGIDFENFNSPTEAYEAAIEYALNNLL